MQRYSKGLSAFLLVLASATLHDSAWAQSGKSDPAGPTAAEPKRTATPGPNAPPQVIPVPDVLRLTDGTFLRGTLLEDHPGDYVIFQLPDGTKQRHPAHTVTYAGPAASDPAAFARPTRPATIPPPTPPSDAVQVKLRALDEAPVTFHYVTSSVSRDYMGFGYSNSGWVPWGGNGLDKTFDRLCTAPCEGQLPSKGDYLFGLSSRSGSIAEADRYVTVKQGATVYGKYISRRHIRIAGLLTGIGSLIGGGLILAWGATEESTIPIIAGSSIMSAGGIAGLVMMLQYDGTQIEVVNPAVNAAQTR